MYNLSLKSQYDGNYMIKEDNKYEKRFRDYLSRNSREIEKAINSPCGLKLYCDYFYPEFKNVNFEIYRISSISSTLYRTKRDIDKSVANISRLKKYFIQYKSQCTGTKRINTKDLEFWTELLNVSLIELLSLKEENETKEDNLKKDFYFYIPEEKAESLILSLFNSRNKLPDYYQRGPLVIPIAIHMLTGSIFLVGILESYDKKVSIQYYMTQYKFSSLINTILEFPGLRYKLSKVVILGNKYSESKEKFMFRCIEVYNEHKNSLRFSFCKIDEFDLNLYEQMIHSSNYLKKVLRKVKR